MDTVQEPITRDNVIKLIAKSSVYGNLGLFIGAGVSKAVLNNGLALSWKELIYKCAEELKVPLEEIDIEGLSYPAITTQMASIAAKKDNKKYEESVKEIKDIIAKLTCGLPSETNRKIYGSLLIDIEPQWIITTNYDLVIESLLTGKCTSLGPNDLLISSKDLIPIYHLHGIRTNPDSIVITQEDYTSIFRPIQYRQQRLPLLIKESTSVLIGYNLGDINVLTSLDWAKNVYADQRINHPQEVIQLLYNPTYKTGHPYKDNNGILILEFNNLKKVLEDIANRIKIEIEENNETKKKEEKLRDILQNYHKDVVNKFIKDRSFRKKAINIINLNNFNNLIQSFLILLSKAFEETWKRAKIPYAFEAYDENLKISLDILENITFKNIPPALFELIAHNLDKVSYYIGSNPGDSYAANSTWNSRQNKIPAATVKELKNTALIYKYNKLYNLLDKINVD